MLDYLFSFNTETGSEVFPEALSHFRRSDGLPLKSYTGGWGTLVTIGYPYPGFDVVENERFILVVLAGPIPRKDDSVTVGNEKDDGSRWILKQWKEENAIAWDEDLVGHFGVLCVDKMKKTAEIVTDINSFVPAYVSEKGPIVIGSHVDAVARAGGADHDIDPVSVADFLTYSTVTYPYTMYDSVRQLPPASVTHVNYGGEFDAQPYWRPVETTQYKSIDEAAVRLREILTENITRICKGQEKVGLLISGGEDSRVVASLIPDHVSKEAVTITESFNREARIARSICRVLDVKWYSVIRSQTHYLDYATDSIKKGESHNMFRHAHLNGLAENLPSGCRIIGANAADQFCKGSHIKEQGIWQYKKKTKEISQPAGINDEVHQRRCNHNKSLRHIRPESWAEWHSLHPAAMNPNNLHAIINRRVFFSYEPFMDSHVVKLSATISQKGKMNRNLFRKSMFPYLLKTWWIPHPQGYYPAFGKRINKVLEIPYRRKCKIKRWMEKRFNHVFPKDGSWPDWEQLVSHAKFDAICPADNDYILKHLAVFQEESLRDILESFSEQKPQKWNNKLRLLQVKLWLEMIQS